MRSVHLFASAVAILAASSALALPTTQQQSEVFSRGPFAGGPVPLPCDAATKFGAKCVAAYSFNRALYAGYSGNLYQVYNGTTTLNVGVRYPGGPVNKAAEIAFCSGLTCGIQTLYDQSGNGNDLTQATSANQMEPATWYFPNGTKGTQAVTGNAYKSPGNQWLRNRTSTKNVPVGAKPLTVWQVGNAAHYNVYNTNNTLSLTTNTQFCCFDFGVMGTTVADNGNGSAFGIWAGSTNGSGFAGPYFGVDLENGTFPNSSWGSASMPMLPMNLYFGVASSDGKQSFTVAWSDLISNNSSLYVSQPRRGLPTTSALASGLGYGPLILGYPGTVSGGLSLGEAPDNTSAGFGAFLEGAVLSGEASADLNNQLFAATKAFYGGSTPYATTPLTLSSAPTILAWFDASDKSTMTFGNYPRVTSWKDKSANGYTATSPAGVYAADSPIFTPNVLNGKSSLRFSAVNAVNGSGQGLQSTSGGGFWTAAGGSTVYVVERQLRAITGNQYPCVISGYAGSGVLYQPCLGVYDSVNGSISAYHNPLMLQQAFAGMATSLPNSLQGYSVNMLGYVVNQFPASGTWGGTFYVNGNSLGAVVTASLTAHSNPTGFYIGTDPWGAIFAGDVFEIIVQSGAASTTQRQQVEGYLACKYGLQGFLPPTHPYFSSCP